MSRRFLPVILPAALLFAAAAAIGRAGPGWLRGWRLARTAVGAVVLGVLGWQYAAAAAPLVPHREYEDITRTIEKLNALFADRDLVLVEGRDAGSDTHVLALPLAYIYGRDVLVLFSPRPDKQQLAAFLEDAFRRYARVLFIGGGGTDLLSRRIGATPVADGRVQVKEYAVAPWNSYPVGVRRKDFDYSVYELVARSAAHRRRSRSTSASRTICTSSASTRKSRRRAATSAGRARSRSSPCPASPAPSASWSS